jgi:hypothetical protein
MRKTENYGAAIPVDFAMDASQNAGFTTSKLSLHKQNQHYL